MNDNNLFDGLRGLLRKQMHDSFMDGVKQGSITTCAIVYETMRAAGLEEDNFLFLMLKEMAKKHGCLDLAEEVAKMQNKETPTGV